MNNTGLQNISLSYSEKNQSLDSMKKGIWLYLFLLIFEGSLRKWLLPGLATPLLVVRDPIAIWLIFMACKKGLFKMNGYMLILFAIGFVSFFMSLIYGHGKLAIAIYGIRILVIYFPLMFVIGRVLSYEDVLKFGRVFIYLAFPMLVLIIMQFLSPQSAWVNRGVGGDLSGAGFGGAMGYYRPPGTFSFAVGNSLYWSTTACFIFYYWVVPKGINRLILIVASASLLVAIPVSIVRSLFFQVLITLFFVIVYSMRNPKNIKRIMVVLISLVVIILVLYTIPIVQTSLEVFASRLTSASKYEGGLEGTFIDRFLGGMYGAIVNSNDLPFWGHGLGLGTNVGSVLMTGGGRTFLIAEEEWGRVIGEMGILLGITFIVLRINLVVKMGIASIKKIRMGDPLPWILISFGGLTILQSQIGQATPLGFFTLIGGFILASLKEERSNET